MRIRNFTLFIFTFIFTSDTIIAGISINESINKITGSHLISGYTPPPDENCDSVAAKIRIIKINLGCGKWNFKQQRDSGNTISINQWMITREPGDTGLKQNVYVFNNTVNPGSILFAKSGTYYIQLKYITISANQLFQCTKTILDSFIIDSTNIVQVNYKTTPPSCYGVKDGSVTFTVSGEYHPFLYQFSNSIFDTITHFEGKGGGSYELTIKDTLQNCSHKFPIAIQDPLKVEMLITKGVFCYNQLGSIKIEPISGIPPFFVKLNEGAFDTVFNLTSLSSNTYKLFLKDSTGCIDSQVVTIKNAAKLIANPIKGAPQSTMKALETYSIDGIFGSKYKWTATKGTIEVDSLYRAIVHWDSAGIGEIKVTVTDQSGCQDSASLQVYLNYLGLDELAQFWGLNVYPNPAKNILNISLQKLPEATQIQLFDLQGKLPLQQELKLTQQLDIETLASGLYLLKIGAWSGQVVKE